MERKTALTIALLLCAAVVQAQTVTAEKVNCIPREENGLVKASISALGVGQTPRLYFRWNQHESFYWVPLEAESGGRYWATTPKPEKRNDAVEYYAAVVDAANKVVARSEIVVTQVTADCRTELSPKEQGVAENLTVGETSPDQQGQKVLGFLCDGVVTRVNHAGIRRADEVCRACVVAWWRKAAFLPALPVASIIITDPPEASPSRP
jgi:hypothetical protein